MNLFIMKNNLKKNKSLQIDNLIIAITNVNKKQYKKFYRFKIFWRKVNKKLLNSTFLQKLITHINN